MPSFLGMPLIAWIQIIVGTGVVLFALIKFLRRPRKKETDGYLIRGDNTYRLEHVPQETVIGVLTGFVRNGKSYTAEDTGYQIYCRIWNAIYPLRKMLFLMRRIAGKTARMLGLRR